MAKNRLGAPQDVTVVSISVTEPPRGRPLRQRLPVHRPPLPLALALAVLGVIVAIALLSRSTGAGRAPVSGAEKAAIAAALGYPYPLRCLTITIADSSPNFATADVDRTHGCGQFHGYLNASFHRIDGAWRLMLDEGQLFVPNSLLAPCRVGCGHRWNGGP